MFDRFIKHKGYLTEILQKSLKAKPDIVKTSSEHELAAGFYLKKFLILQ